LLTPLQYTQTPYRAAIGLTHGVDVMTTLFNEIDGKMNRAIKIKADKVLGKFASYMRVNMLRVSDMIERVDTSCDGVVDEEELAAAIKMVKLDLTEDEISTLFKFLDDDNSGHIDAQEVSDRDPGDLGCLGLGLTMFCSGLGYESSPCSHRPPPHTCGCLSWRRRCATSGEPTTSPRP